ncbi:alpha/beta hydrolase [Microcella pacifica]|uniref:Alpha/beta hydrolase n=1 Tax=Microcella pacifica TaxID=2591847 RepID=A0A9E5ME50_9MICO|nr:alpha/beta hydrolase [Microcella pacifica]NHF62162.1 alpha/beta hydrolase [Microcella pacifica]
MSQTQRMIELLNENFPDLAALPPLEARATADARVRTPDNLDDVAGATDHRIDDHGVPVRVYVPHSPRAGAPVTVFAHGGGFLHGSIASHDGFCRRWSRGTGTIVVSVGYRLAPEHRAPAGVDDVLAAVDWVLREGLGTEVVLAGDSAGATLAAIASLRLRDRGHSPVRAQVLLYPFLDPTMSSESHRALATGTFVTGRLLSYYWEVYLGDEPRSAITADVNPSLAERHDGLPPAIVVTAGRDPLCDEGRDYAQLLSRAGVHTTHRHYPDQFHGFATIPNYAPSESAAHLLWSDLADALSATAEETP